MASYETRGKSTRAVVSINRRKLQQTFDTKLQAKQWAKQIEAKKAQGNISPATGRFVDDVFKAYESVSEESDSAKWNSLRLAKFRLHEISRVPLDEVTPDNISSWVNDRKKARYRGKPISSSTINRELNLMSAAFTHAWKVKKWIKENPCHDIGRPPKGRPRKRPPLLESELQAIAAAGGYVEGLPIQTQEQRVVICFFIALETGMRSGEILRVRPHDLSLEKLTVYVHALEKGGRKGAKSGQRQADRTVPLTARAMQCFKLLLAAMPTEQEPREGFSMPPYVAGMTDQQRDVHWRKIRDASGVEDLTFHDTKHEAATRLAPLMDVIALSHVLGTKDIKLLRDTYYINDAEKIAMQLPSSLVPHRVSYDTAQIRIAPYSSGAPSTELAY